MTQSPTDPERYNKTLHFVRNLFIVVTAMGVAVGFLLGFLVGTLVSA